MKTDLKKIHHQLILPDTDKEARLDQVLAKYLADYSRTQIQEWIQSGSVLVNGQPVKPKTKVKGGETVILDAELKPQPAWKAEALHLNIVHEDESIIVINKPAGLVVHPGAGNTNHTLLNALLHHAPALDQLPRAGILHRLDKDTTGLLMIAKTPAALKNLSQQLKKREILREYQAVVYGPMISGGMVNAPINRHPLQRKRMAVVETGKEAITHYRIAEKFRAHTHLKLRLETGRTHQIRVHLSHVNHPLVGDLVYGGRVQLAKSATPELIHCLRHFKRQALHAFALGVNHPLTQEWIRFEIPLPEDMIELIRLLRDDTKYFAMTARNKK